MKAKKIISSVMLLVIMLFSGVLLTACGGDKISKIVSATGLENEIVLNSQYDYSKAKIEVKMESGTVIEINSADLQFSTLDTSTVGTKILTISYTKDDVTITYDFAVEVYADYVTQMAIVSGINTSVELGGEFSTADAVARLTYKSGKTEDVTADKLTFSEIDTSVEGEQTLTVSYTKDGSTKSVQVKVLVYENRVVSYGVKEGTMPTEVNAGEKLDTDAIIFELQYLNGNTSEIGADELTFTEIDPYEIGEQTVSITYNNGQTQYSVTKTIAVVKNYDIFGFDSPSFVIEYNANSQKQNTYTSTGSTGVKSFAETGKEYVVGTNNEFVYAPILTVIDEDLEFETLEKYKVAYKVYLVNNDNTKTLVGEEYVKVNELEHTIKFTKDAEGKTFVISALPKFYADDESVFESTFQFKVIDGYNIYDAKELSIIDNVNAGGKWTEFKKENNIDLAANVSTVILHSNIEITNDDIPSLHFYTEAEVAGDTDAERAAGSLKDADIGYKDTPGQAAGLKPTDDGVVGAIYRRAIAENSSFTIKGNYFTISAQNLSRIVRDSGDISTEGEAIITHTAVLMAEAYMQNALSNAEFNMEDIALFGNANKSNNVELSGGVMFLKTRNVVANITNNLSQSWYMSYMFRGPQYNDASCYTNGELTETKVLVKLNKVNAFDAYNTLIYLQGAGHVEFNDCNMIGAGGPVIIADHAIDKNASSVHVGRPTFITVKNSIFESYVAGSESWFISMNAGAIVGQIKAINDLFGGIKSTIESSVNDINNAYAYAEQAYGADLSAYKINISLNDKSILFRNNICLNLMVVFKSDNTIGGDLMDFPVASTFNDVSVNAESQLLYIDGADMNERNEKYSSFAGYNILKAFNGFAVIPNADASGLVYQNPYIDVDQTKVTNAIQKYLGTGDDSDLVGIKQQFENFANVYNDADNYFAGYLFNNMGIVLGLQGNIK